MDHISINHRYLWNSRFVREQLHANALSEGATFAYFLVIMAFELAAVHIRCDDAQCRCQSMVCRRFLGHVCDHSRRPYLPVHTKRRLHRKGVPAPLLSSIGDGRLEVRHGHGSRHMACRLCAFRNKYRGSWVDFNPRSHGTQRRDVLAYRSPLRKPGWPMTEQSNAVIEQAAYGKPCVPV